MSTKITHYIAKLYGGTYKGLDNCLESWTVHGVRILPLNFVNVRITICLLFINMSSRLRKFASVFVSQSLPSSLTVKLFHPKFKFINDANAWSHTADRHAKCLKENQHRILGRLTIGSQGSVPSHRPSPQKDTPKSLFLDRLFTCKEKFAQSVFYFVFFKSGMEIKSETVSNKQPILLTHYLNYSNQVCLLGIS